MNKDVSPTKMMIFHFHVSFRGDIYIYISLKLKPPPNCAITAPKKASEERLGQRFQRSTIYVHICIWGFQKWWYLRTMGFPTKNDHFGVFWWYHHLRKPPYRCVYFHNRLYMCSICFLVLFMFFIDKLCFFCFWYISFFLTYEKGQWQNHSSCESNSPCEAVDFRRSIGKMVGFWA